MNGVSSEMVMSVYERQQARMQWQQQQILANGNDNDHFSGLVQDIKHVPCTQNENAWPDFSNDPKKRKTHEDHKLKVGMGCKENDVKEKKAKGCSQEEPTKTSSKSNVAEAIKQDFIHVRARRGQATDSHSLAERVRVYITIENLVNDVQSAFIANRQILDGPFILNELIHWCKAKKKETMSFKVDFEKAFDSVRWDFLEDVLKKFGFGSCWCDWIVSCLKSSKGLVLVNGSPTSEFQLYKGLKQGDPLSPFLFILVMETLHLSFQNVVNAGLFKGVVLNNSLQLSYLFYIDDAIFI
nr:RNA-directed DNA polymerase, eukaryota [Tanacetum cinerariifolium]